MVMARAPHTEETKQRIRAALMDHEVSEETREKMRAMKVGRPGNKHREIRFDVTGAMSYRCGACRGFFPREMYGACSKGKDGIKNRCRRCHNATSANKDREKHLETRRNIDARHRANNAKTLANKTAEYRQQNPEKTAAHTAVNNAVALGKLAKPAACEDCGQKKRLHGHHDDYSRPLAVKWLCSVCHAAEHKRIGRAKPQSHFL